MRECPKCRTAVRVNRLEEDENRIKNLIGQYQEGINQNDLVTAKKILKELTIINRTVDNQEISVFIKTQRKELMKMENIAKQKIAL